MNQPYCFSQEEEENILAHFGSEFPAKAAGYLEIYSDKWSLSHIRLIPSYSANLVFTCYSDSFGEAILKINPSVSSEFTGEYHALKEYGGKPYCRLFCGDRKGVLLEERINPGTPLRDEPSLDKRLQVFSSLSQGLHKSPGTPGIYKTYTQWVLKITDYMNSIEDYRELALHMNRAKEIYLELSSVYNRNLLLHGDFHHDNILLEKDGNYRIIDPKGVMGDPLFDIPRFILNEFDEIITRDTYDKINYVVKQLSAAFDIPETAIRQALYVETAMGMSWCAEDGMKHDDYSLILKSMSLAEEILKA